MLALLSALATGKRAKRAQATVELVAVGDILLARGVARRIEGVGTQIVFARVRDIISGADVAFANLECPLAQTCERAPQRIAFRAEPRNVTALTRAGFDIVSLANNHSMDCGRVGLSETIDSLRRAGLRWCGAGRTRAEAEAPVLLNVKGIRIAFVAFTAIAPAARAYMKTYGPAVAIASREALTRAVGAAKLEADVVIASLHWGEEYASRPDSEQRELAHAAVEAGADLVIGHHTHTLEGFELINRPTGAGKRYALIAYSLGNFAFDSPRSLGKRVTESVVLSCVLSREGVLSAGIKPVMLENYLPRPARTEEAQSILSRLSALSAELNTRITNGRIVPSD
jgi:poly-gamma-glutamate capsule biosynthesis protein CapA/YwtB (metallophosphatase superfamily)